MVFGLFSKKCPYCKSKISGAGVKKDGKVFCCPNCVAGFEKGLKEPSSEMGGCCGGSSKKNVKKAGCCS